MTYPCVKISTQESERLAYTQTPDKVEWYFRFNTLGNPRENRIKPEI